MDDYHRRRIFYRSAGKKIRSTARRRRNHRRNFTWPFGARFNLAAELATSVSARNSAIIAIAWQAWPDFFAVPGWNGIRLQPFEIALTNGHCGFLFRNSRAVFVRIDNWTVVA